MKNRIMTVNTVFVENLEDAVVNIEKFFEEHDDMRREIIMTKRANAKKTELIVGWSTLADTKWYYMEVWYDNNKIEGNFDYPIKVYKLSEDKEERRIALYAAIDIMNAALRGEYETVKDDPKVAQLEEAIKEAILTGETKINIGRRWVIYYTPHESGGILTLKAARQTHAEKAVILNNLSWGIGEAAGELYDYLNAIV